MSFQNDIWKYAPDFNQAQEWEAREQGYDSAMDKWVADMDYKSWVHQAEATVRHGKAQAESDVNSVGTPYDRLGAVSEAVRRLPGTPEYAEPAPQSTKDPVTRAARIHGLTRYAARLMKASERKGVPWRTALQGEQAHNADVAHLKAEWENARQRLEVLGEDLDDLTEGIAAGTIQVTEAFEPDIQPDDPELRRVYDAWNRDQQAQHADQEETNEESEEDQTAHEWLAQRNEECEVEFDPIPRCGPNGHAEAPWWKEADGWNEESVYDAWGDEEE